MKIVFSFLFAVIFSVSVFASEDNLQKSEEFDPTDMIMHHISDAHSWHVISWGEGENEFHIEVPLPVILISDGRLHVFLFSRFNHRTHVAESRGEYFSYSHGKIYKSDELGVVNKDISLPIDLSITKNVWSMWLSVAIILLIFIAMARKYSDKPAKPTGIQSLLEPLVLFVRNDIAIEQIGKEKGDKFVPYLLTVFFFIWINNLIGLVPLFPGGSNFTGNISVTLVLSVITFLITNFSGSKGYWKHILVAPGVPFFVKVLLVPVEIIGLFTKPFALAIRLLANITAGHIIILSLVSLIFILQTVWISPVSVLLSIIMFILELLVAILQAYIFTLLSAMFIGMAVAEEEH